MVIRTLHVNKSIVAVLYNVPTRTNSTLLNVWFDAVQTKTGYITKTIEYTISRSFFVLETHSEFRGKHSHVQGWWTDQSRNRGYETIKSFVFDDFSFLQVLLKNDFASLFRTSGVLGNDSEPIEIATSVTSIFLSFSSFN